jgi:hypothetical protein
MNTKVSKSQQEVWEWKNKAFEKLQKLPRKDWLKEIRKSTQQMVDKLNKSVQLQHK